jgi:hypothetical protein
MAEAAHAILERRQLPARLVGRLIERVVERALEQVPRCGHAGGLAEHELMSQWGWESRVYVCGGFGSEHL